MTDIFNHLEAGDALVIKSTGEETTFSGSQDNVSLLARASKDVPYASYEKDKVHPRYDAEGKHNPYENELFFNMRDQKTYYYKKPAENNFSADGTLYMNTGQDKFWQMVAELSSELVHVRITDLRKSNKGALATLSGYDPTKATRFGVPHYSHVDTTELRLGGGVSFPNNGGKLHVYNKEGITLGQVNVPQTFNEGQTVYDSSGINYTYMHPDPKRPGFHYVETIIIVQTTNYHGDDYDEHETEGPITVIENIYAKPPVVKVDADITAKLDELSGIQKNVNVARHDLAAIKRSTKNAERDLNIQMERFPNHVALVQLLEGKHPEISVNPETLQFSFRAGWDKVEFNTRTGEMSAKGGYNNEGRTYLLFDTKAEAAKWAKEEYHKRNSTHVAKKTGFTEDELLTWRNVYTQFGLQPSVNMQSALDAKNERLAQESRALDEEALKRHEEHAAKLRKRLDETGD